MQKFYRTISILLVMASVISSCHRDNHHLHDKKFTPHIKPAIKNPSSKSKQAIKTATVKADSSSKNYWRQLTDQKLLNLLLDTPTNKNDLLTLDLANNLSAKQTLSLTKANIGIALIYTNMGLKAIHPQRLIKLAKDINQKPQSILNIYYLNYANHWYQFLDNINIVIPTEPKQAMTTLAILSKANSPIIELIKLFNDNTPINNVIRYNGQLQSLKYAATQPNMTYSTVKLQKNLKQLQQFLQPIQGDNKIQAQKTAFKLAVKRMRNQGKENQSNQDDPIQQLFTIAQTAPRPLQKWLYQISQGYWHMLLVNATLYLNNQWQKEIFIPYHHQIATYYPFNLSAKQSLTMDDFSRFFAPEGLFDQFQYQYLQPFLNTTTSTLSTKSLEGMGIVLSHNSLVTQQQLKELQHIYFSHNNHHIYVPFRIQITKLPKQLKQIVITLGQQPLYFNYNNLNKPQSSHWNGQNVAQIVVINKDNKKQQLIKEKGAWSWLTLLNKDGKLKKLKNNRCSITFNYQGKPITLIITTEQSNNPFSLNHLSQFKLPLEL